jgi:putative membrane-bound dehydrogenase-like protein
LLLTVGGLAMPSRAPAENPAPPGTPPAPAAPAPLPPVQVSDLRVPDGFVVERVAGPPLVEYPMMAGFDERGRLFVAENAGVNLPFEQLVADPPSKILMLEDTDADGTFDRRTVFADKLTFPSGALWHRGALYVTSPPGLWRFEDTDGDGVADKRQEIVTGFGSTGNAADLHGPFLGPEGWLYFCDGRNGHDVRLGDGTQWKGRAACVYRCRPDGSGLEVVFGGGFDNPVEVAFTPEGEPLVNVNIVNAQPHRVDAILYGIEGGNYPYEPAWQELKRTGDFLPSAGDLGWVATSGFMRYRGWAFGSRYQGRFFSTEFNQHRVRSHVVERDGAGFRVTHEDFLTCSHPDFHPTDVLQDADGSLLVIDTGGWFRIGCPQSQIAKPDVKGGIYRIRRTDGKRIDDPRGLSLKWDGLQDWELVEFLGDPRPAVVDRAVAEFARRADPASPRIESFVNSHGGRTGVQVVWALAQIGSPDAWTSVYRLLHSTQDRGLKIATLRALGLSGGEVVLEEVLALLERGSAAEAREAAMLLGRIRARDGIAPLFDAMAHSGGDRFLEHAIIYALIRIADADATRAGLSHKNTAVRRAALIALDQMDNGAGGLTAELVVPHLASEDPLLRQAALSIATARAEWAGQMTAPIQAALAKPTLDAREAESLRRALAAFAKAPAIQSLVAEVLGRDGATEGARILMLQAVAESGVSPLPDAWVEPMRRSLAAQEASVALQAVEAVRATRAEQFLSELTTLARDAARPVAVRVAALAAALPRSKAVDPADFRLLLGELAADRPPLERLAAAQALSAAPLDDAQLAELAGAVGHAGPMELPALLGPFERSGTATVGRALLDALDASKALTSLTPAGLTSALAKYPDEVRQSAQPLLAKINPDAAAQQARLAELEPLLAGGDPSRGQSVFFGKVAACATCHAVKGVGAAVGPDLTKIGAIRAGRDLLESVVFPSSSFARGYEPFVVQTTGNVVHAGTLAGESGDALVLRTPAEVRVPRSAVKSIRQDRVSIMPQGLDEQLSRQELADLLAFLQSLK